jgi:SAM domain (Sterile alpha motif)
MQEIADWLEKLGMSEYAQRFAENDIDASVLPHLTDQSLKELGVSLGHRLKILAAVLGGRMRLVSRVQGTAFGIDASALERRWGQEPRAA